MKIPSEYKLDPQPTFPDVDYRDQFPMSFAQQRLWFLAQMEGASEAYQIPIGLRLKGVLDHGALFASLDRIVARHEVLRTTFAFIDEQPVQRIAAVEDSRFHVVEHDLSGCRAGEEELARLTAEEASVSFDLEAGPLIRGRLIRLADDEHALLITMHHIVSDGWSMGVLVNELSALYGAFLRGAADPLPSLEIQYADYAVWQRQWIEGEVLQQQGAYWKTALADVPALLELPSDHPRPAQKDYAGAFAGLVLDEGLTAGLKELSRRHGVTLYMTILAGWAALLARLSGQQDVVVGTPTANRGRAEIEGLIGFFVNTLAMRVDLSGSPTVGDLLEQVKSQALAAQHHQDIPFEQVVEILQPVRSLSHSPLFQVMFAWQNNERGTLQLPGLELHPLGTSPHRMAKFDLTLSLGEAGKVIAGGLEYATSLFERETIERYLGYFRKLLEAMVADDAQAVDRLPMLGEAERNRVLYEWNDTRVEYPSDKCVHELFEAQVEKTPDAVAVVFEDEQLSYGELNARANRLSHYLRELGVKPDDRVAICVERGFEMIIALLGVLKAGGAYVPLDPAYPLERLRFMIEDSHPVALLTQTHLRELFDGIGDRLPVLELTDDTPWRGQPGANPDPNTIGLKPSHLAYVIYTSGSTGQPKGVAIEHASLVNFLRSIEQTPGIEPADALLAVTTFSFDIAALEFYLPLIVGARVVMARRHISSDPAGLIRCLQHGITVLQAAPATWRMLFEAGWKDTIEFKALCGGEALSKSLCESLFAHSSSAWNLYGPTETTVWSLLKRLDDRRGNVSIGRPIANTRVYILDAHGEPVPVGVGGELYIGGAGVARGYLNRPELTAEKFLSDPFVDESGARMYRTGDLGRWLADGNIEFLGRNDYQVKIRGFRIELGEIESRLMEHPAVREAVVIAREDVPGEKRLAAYYTVSSDEMPGAEQLRSHLSAVLPEYMVPSAYVRLEALPLTANGKLDRRGLPAPEQDAYATEKYEPPQGEMEEKLAAVWAEVLKLDRVGRRDNFFSLGGHSLLAVRVVSRIRQLLGLEAAIRDLFAHPTLADLARTMQDAVHAQLPFIVPAERGGRLPLSFAQQRLWFLAQMEGASEAYQIPIGLRLKGVLDHGALFASLDRIVARHEVLRTTFAFIDEQPVQRIAAVEDSRFHVVEHDLSGCRAGEEELARLTTEEASVSFDLEAGPLIRGRLIRLADDEHALLITMHHIVSDGWSMGVLVNELSALYGAFLRGAADPLPSLEIQYADYAVWQRQWIEGEVLQQQGAYWKTALADVPALLELPSDHPRPAQKDYAGAFAGLVLDEGLTAGLKELSRRHGVTLYMTILAGWAALLARLSGQQDVVVGTPTANRGRAEIEGLIGFFVNTLAMRVDLSGSPTVGDLLEQVKSQALAAQHHQDIPFEQVVEILQPVRSLSHSPLFQVMFAWQNNERGTLQLPGLELHPLGTSPHRMAKFDLTLSLGEAGKVIAGGLEYATSLFERETIERYLGYFRKLLEAMVADDAQAVDRLPMLGEAERNRVLYEWNDTRVEYPSDKCVHELFEAQVEKTPDAVAVVFEDEQLSYGELNARANRLSHYLRELGVKPDDRVAICVERGFEMIIALLGVLKAGGAYVPLDPAYPLERLRFMIEDSHPVALLTQTHLRELFDGIGDRLPVLELTDDTPWRGQPGANPDPNTIGLKPSHLAYVIYTSGSTGSPKGVMIQHSGLYNYLNWAGHAYYQDYEGGSPAIHSIGFDGLVTTVYAPLLTGQTLFLPVSGAEIEGMHHREPLTPYALVKVTPSHLKLLNCEISSSPEVKHLTRTLMVGGETLIPSDISFWQQRFPEIRLINHFGPTEATVGCCTFEITQPVGTGPIPIGRPIANTRVYILDAHGEPVPVGVAGELHIAGVQVARGYLNRPELTAEKFLSDPFVDESGARMYRTGDLGRWLADGNIEFLGRNDYQVKIRGFRIELGEIESRLMEHPDVREAVVIAREDVPGEKRLAAYYTVSSDEMPGAEQLRSHLSAVLPEYMVPSAYVRLEALPLTANGKLDRRGLPAPEQDAYATEKYEPPQGEMEEKLAAVWAEVLKLDRVGRRDNFFSLGGHSLLAVRVVSRIRQLLGLEAAIRDLFAHPTLADLARTMQDAVHAQLPFIVPAERGGRLPLSFAQQRLWFLAQMEGASEAYQIPIGLRLKGVLDHGALFASLDRIVARHEVLRTTFAFIDEQPVQRIAAVEDSRFHVVEHDLSGCRAGEEELARLTAEEASVSFDLEAGPLIRGRLIRLADDEHALLITMHHIVSDGWSMGVLVNELSALYGAFLRGAADPLPSLEIQYADYAVWQRQWIEGEVLQQQGAYWKTALADVPALLELPSDHPRPAQKDYAGAFAGLVLDEGLTAGLKELSRRHGVTLYMTILAGWAALLARLSGQQDVVVGTPTANRGRAEIEGLIGFFVNTLAMRVDLSGSPTVGDLLEQVKSQALAAQHHQDIPFEQVVEILQPVRSLSHSPLFQVMFAWQNNERGTLQLPGLELHPLGTSPHRMAKFDLTLSLGEAGKVIAGGLEYATSLFERETIERYLGYFRKLLEAMVADDAQAVDRLPMLGEAERNRVLYEWNDTRVEYPSDKCVHELFEAQVEKTPDAVAVVFEDEQLSYGELNARANRLSHYLRELGVKPDDRVAICVERGFEMIIALLGVLKAGGAYVPLDPAYPLERLRFMIEDSHPVALLTQTHLRELFDGIGDRLPVLELTDDTPWRGQPGANPDPNTIGLKPSHLAYVIYTSGSTGSPKGVMIQHSGLYNYLNWAIAAYVPTKYSVVSSPLSFDATVTSLWGALLCGGAIQLLRDHQEIDDLNAVLLSPAKAPLLKLTPWLLDALALRILSANGHTANGHTANGHTANGHTSVRLIIVGGEALLSSTVQLWRKIQPDVRIINEYGPTETVVGGIVYEIPQHVELTSSISIPIGRPIANTRVYILDAHGEPVPVGVGGELYIGGAGVARGYLNRPELTAEKFLSDPFVDESGARMYRTGDLGRWLADGNIEFLGRNDYQVKIRGFRIELGEIESRLMEHPAVREAVVIAREDVPGEKRLAAYYTVSSDEMPGAEQLRSHLSAVLPEYMVPSAYVRLEALPLTANGKLDRRGLPAPEQDAYATEKYEPPQGEMEEKLAAVWAEVLKLDRVGRRDNFFSLGGHSLLAVRATTRIRGALNIEMGIRELFAHPVVYLLAQRLVALRLAQFSSEDIARGLSLMQFEMPHQERSE